MSPAIQASSASTCARSRAVAFIVIATGGSSRVSRNRDVGQFVREHREIAAQTMRKTKLGIGSEGTRKMLRGIAAVF